MTLSMPKIEGGFSGQLASQPISSFTKQGTPASPPSGNDKDSQLKELAEKLLSLLNQGQTPTTQSPPTPDEEQPSTGKGKHHHHHLGAMMKAAIEQALGGGQSGTSSVSAGPQAGPIGGGTPGL